MSPGLVERIVVMAETEGQHRHDMERSALEADIAQARGELDDRRLGQLLGFTIATVATIAGAVVTTLGHDWAGAALGVSGVAGLAAVFVRGQLGRRWRNRTGSSMVLPSASIAGRLGRRIPGARRLAPQVRVRDRDATHRAARALESAEPMQAPQVIGRRARRGEPQPRGQLPHRRRTAALVHVGNDPFHDLALSGRWERARADHGRRRSSPLNPPNPNFVAMPRRNACSWTSKSSRSRPNAHRAPYGHGVGLLPVLTS